MNVVIRVDGLAILQHCVEQAKQFGLQFYICPARVIDAVYAISIIDHKVLLYVVQDLAAFAHAHQDLLDANPSISSFESAVSLLNRKYKVCQFETTKQL